ncbi:MAG: hypothetical protein ACFFDN_43420, partial [Candidatus Hodarchaeota archaeon]
FIIFLSLALLVPYKHAQKVLLIGFSLSILLLLAGFVADNLILLSLTPLSYFDYIGVFLEKKTLLDVLPSALVCTFFALAIYGVTLRKIVPTRDRLV